MSDGTTLTRTTPLAELHPDAPITITRRQLERAFHIKGQRYTSNYAVPQRLRAQFADAVASMAVSDADELLNDLHLAAQQLQQEQCAQGLAA